MAVKLPSKGCFPFTISKEAAFGRYEYVVLFDTESLARPERADGFVSKWGQATGGSSSEFIIRPRGRRG
jgi:hypothetical protein